ncbi:MAG: hypothetical protein M0Q25_00205 [Sulfurospirillaceae bacterium]|nr:hypothetical protein [Sulfurospirillaceae bacterium]
MNILAELEEFINEFNQNNDEDFAIDSIRVEYQKQHKQEKLMQLGNWHKINANDKRIMAKLKKRLTDDEVTTAYQLEKHNIYYYNSSTPPKYNKATLVIFGMKQYHKSPPPYEIINRLLNILSFGTSKINMNIDICSDTTDRPDIDALKRWFDLKQYITKEGVFTDTHYINRPEINMIEKIIIYNKQVKNNLAFMVWRIEAKVIIPNFRMLALPLHDLKEVTDIARGH